MLFKILCLCTGLLLTFGGTLEAEAAQDQNVKIGVVGFSDSLEPTEPYVGWVVTRYGIGETLTRFNEYMEIKPWLAESWSLADDKLTWTFKIRQKVKFSNGNIMNAEAVKKSS